MKQMKKTAGIAAGIGSASDRLYRRHFFGGEQHCIPGAAHR